MSERVSGVTSYAKDKSKPPRPERKKGKKSKDPDKGSNKGSRKKGRGNGVRY